MAVSKPQPDTMSEVSAVLSSCMEFFHSAFSCCYCCSNSVHPGDAEAAAKQHSSDYTSDNHRNKGMRGLTPGVEGGMGRKAPEGIKRQKSMILGSSDIVTPMSRSTSGPAYLHTWSAGTDGLALPMRGGSERILRHSHSLGNASASMSNAASWSRSFSGRGDESQPPRSLLEASSRRAARHSLTSHEGGNSAADQAVVTTFMAAYAAAAAAQDCKWATAAAVAGVFADNAVLVTQDKQTFHGRLAVVARLNQGMELLCKTMGENPDEKSFSLEVTQPESVPGEVHSWIVMTTFKRGIMRFRLKNEFKLNNDCTIESLRFTRT